MQETTPERPEDVHVRLKPFFGVPPARYLPALYALLLAIIVFLLLFLPGIVRFGTVYTVTSLPTHAAVSVDGVIVGSTTGEFFVPAGPREIEISRPGFAPLRQLVQVRGRVIGSLIAPRREALHAELTASSPDSHVAAAAGEFASWSFVGEASGQYQFPPIARELARDLAAAGSVSRFVDFAGRALMHVDSEAQLADLAAGSSLAHGGGGAPSPLALARAVQDLARAAKTPGLPAQLAGLLVGPRGSTVEDSSWARAAAAHLAAALADADPVESAGEIGAVRGVAGMAFVQVPAGAGTVGGTPRARGGGDLGYRVETAGFLVTQTEVPVSAYDRFVSDVPFWNLDNRADLMEAGLVDADYLRDWEDGKPSATLPVRYVSAHAARAFADWVTTQVSASGLVARLPDEAEWDYVAALDSPGTGVFAVSGRTGPSPVQESGRGGLGLYGVAGNVWEWTGTTFARYARYHPDRDPLPSSYLVVRGGGWATAGSEFTLDDRGAVPADWCSGAIGFRVLLTEP